MPRKKNNGVRCQYTPEFLQFWDTFPAMRFGNKGSKSNAFSEYQALVGNRIIKHAELLVSAKRQVAYKTFCANRGDRFIEPFQHLERWLRNGRYDDDYPEVPKAKPVEKVAAKEMSWGQVQW